MFSKLTLHVLKEALRVLEEYGKLHSAEMAADCKQNALSALYPRQPNC